ncbi:MAG TPA: hypothetical protein VG206_11390 [Terriglobia bacterium]|nr:hypothetical protein [Terriglobia bacterium]
MLTRAMACSWKTGDLTSARTSSAGNAGGDPHYTWSAFLCQVALDQYVDNTPWDGFRLGILNPPSDGEIRGSRWGRP